MPINPEEREVLRDHLIQRVATYPYEFRAVPAEALPELWRMIEDLELFLASVKPYQ